MCQPFRRIDMNKMLIIAPLTVLVLSACVVTPADRVVVAPPLPVIVELDTEPYYHYRGYYYYYDNQYWRYSTSRSGPWVELPRSHYPKETRFKGHRHGRDRHDDDRDRRDYERDRYDRR
jgi:hypothetical protein